MNDAYIADHVVAVGVISENLWFWYKIYQNFLIVGYVTLYVKTSFWLTE
jgi:hypothetical protein